MKRAIFPLPLVLLPGGVTRLRIFEQRYLRMVKQAANDMGFVLTTADHEQPHGTSPIGSLVRIVDFETLPDGMLGIDIRAEQAVVIGDVEVEPDGLLVGEVMPCSHWLYRPLDERTTPLSEKLSTLLADNPPLSQFYPDPKLDDAAWVCARWIEVLPIEPRQKVHFFAQGSYDAAVDLLSAVVTAR